MTIKSVHGYRMTPEQKARAQEVHEMFHHWRPSPEELIASGEGQNFQLFGEFRGLRDFVAGLKAIRLAKGLTLADVAARCGADQPSLSRLENGHYRNPTLDTLWRYAAALGRQLVLTTEEIADTRPGTKRKKTARKRAKAR